MTDQESPVSRTREKSKPRALVVEDSDVVGHLLRVLLEVEGFEVNLVLGGRTAQQQAETWGPDVILLDIALPDEDGRSLLQRLKSAETTSRVPVVIVSAFSDLLSPADRHLAAHVIAKPFDVEDLLAAVQVAIDSQQQAER